MYYIECRFYSDESSRLIHDYLSYFTDTESLKSFLVGIFEDDGVIFLPDDSGTQTQCTLRRTNVMVRNLDGHLVSWKHLL